MSGKPHVIDQDHNNVRPFGSIEVKDCAYQGKEQQIYADWIPLNVIIPFPFFLIGNI